MRNIQFNNCDGILVKQCYLYDEDGEVSIGSGKSLDNMYIMSNRSNYEKI